MQRIRHALVSSRAVWLALTVAIGLALAACGSTAVGPDAGAEPTGAADTIPAPPPDADGGAASASSAPPTPERSTPAPIVAVGDIPAIRTGATVIAHEQFVHRGFRTQVDHSFEITALPPSDTAVNLTVNLENLSTPSGSIGTRATINFAGQFDNYIELPTSAGPLVLHLHRDGTLRSTPDDGPFT